MRKELDAEKRVAVADVEVDIEEVDYNKPLSDEQIQEEISELRGKILQDQRKEKKKKLKIASKSRGRQALGMSSDSFGVEEDEELFSLHHSMKSSDLDALIDVDLDDEEAVVFHDEEDELEAARVAGRLPVIIHAGTSIACIR